MGAAAALEAGERIFDLGVSWFLVLSEERCRGHHPAVDAIAALRHLLLDVGLLDRVRLLRRAEAGQGDDFAIAHRGERRDARAHGLPIDVHGAGAALCEPTAEMRL